MKQKPINRSYILVCTVSRRRVDRENNSLEWDGMDWRKEQVLLLIWYFFVDFFLSIFFFILIGKNRKKKKRKFAVRSQKMKLNNLFRVVLSLMQNIGCHKHAFLPGTEVYRTLGLEQHSPPTQIYRYPNIWSVLSLLVCFLLLFFFFTLFTVFADKGKIKNSPFDP